MRHEFTVDLGIDGMLVPLSEHVDAGGRELREVDVAAAVLAGEVGVGAGGPAQRDQAGRWIGGPRRGPPKPPALVAPRRSRGAPRNSQQLGGEPKRRGDPE